MEVLLARIKEEWELHPQWLRHLAKILLLLVVVMVLSPEFRAGAMGR